MPPMTPGLEGLLAQGQTFAIQSVAALVLWFAGRYAIGVAMRVAGGALQRSQVDPTLQRWIASVGSIVLNLFLILTILNVFGINTTSFAALIAAAGLAIGAAWAGLLANFAAGIFLILFKPFRVGDEVHVASTSGTVIEIGIFATAIDTGTKERAIVGNAAISGATIVNYSVNPLRSAEIKVLVPAEINLDEGLATLAAAIASVPGVAPGTEPEIEVTELTELGPRVLVTLSCRHSDMKAVSDGANRAIARAMRAAGYPQPGSRQIRAASLAPNSSL
jgi:small conductance mechanosensitive channel